MHTKKDQNSFWSKRALLFIVLGILPALALLARISHRV